MTTPTGSDPDWDGSARAIENNQSVFIPQTPTSPLVIAAWNNAAQSAPIDLQVSNGGSFFLRLAPLASAPTVLVRNFEGKSVRIRIQTAGQAVVELYGPGIPGQAPQTLTSGSTVTLTEYQTAQAGSVTGSTSLTFRQSSGQPGVFLVLGRPKDGTDNVYLIQVNSASGNTGGEDEPDPPTGFHATTSDNFYTFEPGPDWAGFTIYTAFLGPAAIGKLTNNQQTSDGGGGGAGALPIEPNPDITATVRLDQS